MSQNSKALEESFRIDKEEQDDRKKVQDRARGVAVRSSSLEKVAM